MNQKNIQKIFQYLTITSIFLVIILSAYSTFLEKSNNKIINFIDSPIYLASWIILILLIFVYPLFVKKEITVYIDYFFIHLPFVLFVFIIMITFMTSRSYELSIQENEKMNISDISKNAL